MKEKLFRSRKNRILGGVASGLADYLNLDPILVRILFVVISIFNGIGIILYIILWIVIPENSNEFMYTPPPTDYSPDSDTKTDTGSKTDSGFKAESDSKASSDFKTEAPKVDNMDYKFDNMYTEPVKKSSGSGRLIAGIIFIGLGIIFIADRIFPYFDFLDLLPVGLILLGVVLIWNSTRK